MTQMNFLADDHETFRVSESFIHEDQRRLACALLSPALHRGDPLGTAGIDELNGHCGFIDGWVEVVGWDLRFPSVPDGLASARSTVSREG